MITETLKREIEAKGFGKVGDIGGQPKQKYWTPDGRMILAMPDMHEFVNRKTNLAGTRDANLDKGWLTSLPSVIKPYCPHCDKWHDTVKEVTVCGNKKKAFDLKYKKMAEKDLKQTDGNERIDKLENDMSDIKSMLKKLLEK
jgi:hypothetical protein